MGEQSASRLEGDRYQYLYAWHELLRLLDAECPFEHGYLEHPEAGSADDVTLHAREGSGVASRFVQVKWHVDHREVYSLDSLTEVQRGKGRPLLHKLFTSWRALRARGPVEVWLVSNWGAEERLGRYLVGRDHSLAPEFFSESRLGAFGEGASRWASRCETTPEGLASFLGDLRLRLGFASIRDLEEQVDWRMDGLGLRQGVNPRAIVLDAMREWVERSGEVKRVTRESLVAFLRARELFAPLEEGPTVSLWVHGWARRRWEGPPPTEELDWTGCFERDTRRHPEEAVWRERLWPELRAARRRLMERAEGALVDVRGKVPLSVSLAVGSQFSEAAGFRLRAEQFTRGETFLWRSDVGASERRLRVVEREGAPEGQALLVVFQLTGDAGAERERFEAEHPGVHRAVLVLEPEEGTGDGAVRSAGDAVAFAVQAREFIRRARSRYRVRMTHLLLYAPSTCALFLGQRLNAVGPVVVHELALDGRYVPVLTVQTG
ncbi:SAVED domain-containing protein [Myxococcus sp. MISCRS1]|uniref:SAVED domain-containing protein n=1 Tax=Myxococcus sp. MISCRS1 TaxID=2996786 RepID=UPI00226E6C7E|nr:SAVED domain-containing protein [Myxococcus sp. MISCRS1]MCY0999879.1 SAVED domain-containing protein [Myxococcus sp. MISCRS1]